MAACVGFILVVLTILVSLCVSQDLHIGQMNTWSAEGYSDDAYRYSDFAPAWNPVLTNEYETQTVEDLEAIDEQCTLYKAKLTQKELYFQYVRYKVDVPDLKEFTLCIWMRSDNLSNDHTIFSYAVEGQPLEIRSWLSNTNRSSYFNLVVGGTAGKIGEESVHLFSINYPFRRRRWYHTCQSWSGITGNWLVYVEGERIGAGNSPATLGRVIRGGGIPVTGQTQHQKGGGFVEEGGIEGEVTLFALYPSAFPKPLREADFEGQRFYRSSCDGLCNVAIPYTFTPSLPQTSILPTQPTESLSLSPAPTGLLSGQLHSTINYYSVREDFFDIEGPFSTFHPASVGIPTHITFQATPVDNGGVQLFSTALGIRVARSTDNFPQGISPTENLADANFESKKLDRQEGIVQNVDYRQQRGLFQPNVGGVEPAVQPQSRNPMLSYGLSAGDVLDGKGSELNPGEVADKTLAYDDTPGGVVEEGFDRDLEPVIDWRSSPKKLYAGAMWLRANPVCRKF